MESHFKLNDLSFEKQFETCQLKPDVFTHEAHLRLAWIHINKYGLENAIENIQQQLKRYVAKQGASSKYNATVTVAAVKMVNHFMRKNEYNDFQTFVSEQSSLKHNFRGLIEEHYSIDIFTSEEAKKEFLKPDIISF